MKLLFKSILLLSFLVLLLSCNKEELEFKIVQNDIATSKYPVSSKTLLIYPIYPNDGEVKYVKTIIRKLNQFLPMPERDSLEIMFESFPKNHHDFKKFVTAKYPRKHFYMRTFVTQKGENHNIKVLIMNIRKKNVVFEMNIVLLTDKSKGKLTHSTIAAEKITATIAQFL